MKTFRRFATTFSASFNSVIDKLEDHNQIVLNNINQAKYSLGQLRSQYVVLSKNITTLENKLQKAQGDKDTWHNRAINSSQNDKNLALKCLMERDKCDSHIKQFKDNLNHYYQVKINLENEIHGLESSIQTLKRKHQELVSRETINEARTICVNDIPIANNIFEKWEQKIIQNEAQHPSSEENGWSNDLNKQFENQENIERLSIELELLSANKDNKENSDD